MSNQSANPRRPLANNKGNKVHWVMALAPPPPIQAGEAEASLGPPCPVNSQKAKGAIRAVTWRIDPRERGQCKEVLVGKGGRVPLPVPLTGRPQARRHRGKIVHPARRIRWVAFRRNKKTRNGYPRPTTKPEQGPQDTLLARAKNSTSLSVDLASCHRIVTAYTYPGPLHISRQHPLPAPSPITPPLARYSPSGGSETCACPLTTGTT